MGQSLIPEYLTAAVEVAVVLEFIVSGGAALCPIELYAAITEAGIDHTAIDDAVDRLVEHGVIVRDRDRALSASPTLAYLSTLGMVCV